MIHIDGGDGGGAVVRTAVGLSVATQQPVEVTNIRAKRPNPGLQAQHLAGVRAAARLSGADTQGMERGSDTLLFDPGPVQREKVRITIETAGAVGLTLQPLQIALLDADRAVDVTVDGGATAGKWAPPVPSLQHVTLPSLEHSGCEQALTVKRHGFYPVGGALTHATLGPGNLEPLDCTERGDIEAINGVSLASTHLEEAEVAERQRKTARRTVANAYPSVELNIEFRYVASRSPGSVIVLWAVTEDGRVIGADTVGEKGKRAEVVGNEAGDALLSQLQTDAPVDEWLADQLIPVLALATGELQVPRFTDHVEHNIAVGQQFVDREWTADRDTGVIRVR